MEIYPSLISGDILNIRGMVAQLDDACDGYHIDVMDDHFVPNLTWGPAFVNQIATLTKRPLDIHLMVKQPAKWLDRLTPKKDDLFIFHHEVFFYDKEIIALIEKVKTLGCGVGVAINPGTSVEKTFAYLSQLDHLLLMSVKPGFSGQKFMPEVVKKVQPLVAFRDEHKVSFTIGMDGGVGATNIGMLAKAGVDIVGSASAIFTEDDPVSALAELYKKAK